MTTQNDLHDYIASAIVAVSARLYEAYAGLSKPMFAPNRMERELLRELSPQRSVETVWMPSNVIPFVDDPVQVVVEELQNAAIEPGRLGGLYCQMERRQGWTTKPRHIANELNASRLYAGVIYPADVVKAQQSLGVWGRRKNIDEWEKDIAS